jgi:RNA polymerase sigma-70 factor (ECF subfamily)
MDDNARFEDLRLVAAFQRGDESAFDLLVDRHRRRVYNLTCRLVSPADAEDLAQEAFIAAYRSLRSFRGEASFSTWLYRVAVHVCSHHVRRRRLAVAELDETEPDLDRSRCPEGAAMAGELQHEVRRAIAGLPYKLRLAIVLRDLHGLTYEEMAQVLGCPVGTVRSRLHYATQRLEASLRSYVTQA